jgi:NapC/NirT cytochrome c family, N-terminal region
MTEKFRNYFDALGGTLLLGAVIMVGAIAVAFGGEHALSRTEFCVSYHSQTYPYEELKKSSHYGALGTDPGCKDCHVPQGLGNFHLALWTHIYDGTRAVPPALIAPEPCVQESSGERPQCKFSSGCDGVEGSAKRDGRQGLI